MAPARSGTATAAEARYKPPDRLDRWRPVDRDVAAGRNHAVERRAVTDDGERAGAPGLDVDGGAVFEGAHVQLTGGDAGERAVGAAVDEQAAGAADALATVVVEGDHRLTPSDQRVVFSRPVSVISLAIELDRRSFPAMKHRRSSTILPKEPLSLFLIEFRSFSSASGDCGVSADRAKAVERFS